MIFKKLRESVKVIVIILIIAFVGSVFWDFGRNVVSRNPQEMSVIARVDGKRIDADAFYRAFNMEMQRQLYYFGGIRPDQVEVVKAYALDRLIDSYLISSFIEKEKIGVSDAELNSALKEVQDFFSSDEEYKTWMSSQGYSEEILKEILRENLKSEKLILQVTGDITVTDAELEAFFNEIKEEGETLDERRDELSEKLLEMKRAEKFDEWLNAYRGKSKISILEPKLAAYNLMIDGDYKGAIKKYNEALKTYGDDPYIYTSIARVYMEMGDKEEALSTYKKALSFSEKDPYLHYLLGNAYVQYGDKENAVSSYKAASELSTGYSLDDLILHSELQYMYVALEMPEDAAQEAEIINKIKEAMLPSIEAETTETAE